MKKSVILIFVLMFSMTYGQEISIIPQPLHIQKKEGVFSLNKSTVIYYEKGSVDLKAIGEKLSDQIKEVTGLQPSVKESLKRPLKNSIILSLGGAPDSLGKEGYILSVSKDRIDVKANKAAGAFYAAQTIYQLLPLDSRLSNNQTHLIPAVEIIDKPRFGWRGMMLDVGRYFYSVDFIKEYIDNIAMHKMNTFHWHLTEDHGWRIEIEKYPRLTEIGAWRDGTQFTRFHEHIDRNPHGGFYTKDEVRDIVKYAEERYITVIPEIEMPGHALAALAAYPELSCTGGPFQIPLEWGIQRDIFCAGNERTFEFLENVLTEIVDLFPSRVIHIGGDEAPKERWKECQKCQVRIKEEKLKDEHELQSYFIQRIEKFLNNKGKKIIGWDEILEGGLAPNAMVMSWRGEAGGIEAAKMHHDVVMAPNTYAYLDYYQGEPYLEPAGIFGFLPLSKVYSYEPTPESFSAEEASYIKGVQANVWAEFIHSPEKVQYMAFPRAAAMAEVAWSKKEHKDWESFKKRIENQYQRYELAGMNYSKSAYNIQIESFIDSATNKARVNLATDSYKPEIRYTVNGVEPTSQSPVYDMTLEIALPFTLKAATFKDGERVSKISSRSFFIKAE